MKIPDELPTPLKRETRAEINRLLQDFTSRGGAIKRYQPGAGGWRPKRAGWSRWAEVRDNPEQFIVDFEDHLAVPLGKADILATDYELKPDESRKPREGYVFNGRFYGIHNGRSLLEDVNAPDKWERAFVAQEVLPGSRRFTRQQINEAMEHSGLLTNTRREVLDRLFKDEGGQS